MNEVYIDVRKQDERVRKQFNADLVSIDQLTACIEELDWELEQQKEKYEEEIKYIKDNVKEYWC